MIICSMYEGSVFQQYTQSNQIESNLIESNGIILNHSNFNMSVKIQLVCIKYNHF